MPLSVHVDPDGACGRLPGGATGFYLQVEDLARARREVEAAGGRVVWAEGNAFTVEDPDAKEFVLWHPRKAWPPAG